jgi:hypothetical protein
LTSDTGCFLCEPDSRLVYRSDEGGVALCGLGPLVPGYTVVGTRTHINSAADATLSVPTFCPFVEDVRARLTSRYGSCVMTEHGRLPLCTDVSGTSETHCYHAHFLLFPGGPAIEAEARGYFKTATESSSLSQALRIAREQKEYVLISDTSSRFVVLTRPGRLIRQFTRVLIAGAVGTPTLANWRARPDLDRAIQDAQELRGSI